MTNNENENCEGAKVGFSLAVFRNRHSPLTERLEQAKFIARFIGD